jgi:hypothetical protein
MTYIYDLARKCTKHRDVKLCFDRALEESKSLLPSQAEEFFEIVKGMLLERQIDLVYTEFIRVKKDDLSKD